MTGAVTIRLIGMRAFGRHGVLPQEQVEGQSFTVDVEVDLASRRAALSDDLEDTVDYRAIVAVVRDVVEGPPVRLIEHLAQRIADRLLGDDRVAAVRVTVTKPDLELDLGVNPAVTVQAER